MGRRKVEMKRIGDKISRQVSFSRRRSGLIKKASELSVLCDVQIALVIFSCRGRLYEFSSAESLAKILERYQRHYEKEAEASKDVNEAFRSHSELLHIVQSQLDEPKQLSLMDLLKLEKQLAMALSEIRARKTQLMMESIITLQEKEKLLRAENELLESKLKAMEKNEEEEEEEDRNEVVIGFSNPDSQALGPSTPTAYPQFASMGQIIESDSALLKSSGWWPKRTAPRKQRCLPFYQFF